MWVGVHAKLLGWEDATDAIIEVGSGPCEVLYHPSHFPVLQTTVRRKKVGFLYPGFQMTVSFAFVYHL